MSASETAPSPSPTARVRDRVAPSVRAERVDVRDSVVGVASGAEISCEDTLVLVARAGRLGGNARVLVEGRYLILAAAILGAAASLCALLRRSTAAVPAQRRPL